MVEIYDFFTKKRINDKTDDKQMSFKTWMPLPIVPKPDFKYGDIIVRITEMGEPNNKGDKVYSFDDYVVKKVSYTMPWLDDIRGLNLTIHTLPQDVIFEWALMDNIAEIIEKYDNEREEK